jgi:hypothetical protein
MRTHGWRIGNRHEHDDDLICDDTRNCHNLNIRLAFLQSKVFLQNKASRSENILMLEGIERGVSRAGWFAVNQGLRVGLAFMEVVNPWWPKWILRLVSQGLLKASDVLNQRWLLDPIMNYGSSAAIKFIRPEHGEAVAEDTKEFLRLGIDQYKVERASGDTTDNRNCFFPESLAAGPSLVPRHVAPMSLSCNVEIAESCAVLSMLAYRHDDVIVDCMKNASPRMLPHTTFYSAHTPEEADLAVFVDDEKSWAVFCFRGTEPETLRDWLTSVLLCEPEPFFEEGNPVRVRHRYRKQMEGAALYTKLNFQTGKLGPCDMCACDLAQSLQEHGCKVYLTGHSLGGGLCTLLGAHQVKTAGLAVSGVISFGSPSVGNEEFCEWFKAYFQNYQTDGQTPQDMSVSWRFVNGDEYAPMAPPLPFTDSKSSEQFRHVGDLICVGKPLVEPGHQRSRAEMVKRMNELARAGNLSKIILDHNLATTLRSLRQLHEERH